MQNHVIVRDLWQEGIQFVKDQPIQRVNAISQRQWSCQNTSALIVMQDLESVRFLGSCHRQLLFGLVLSMLWVMWIQIGTHGRGSCRLSFKALAVYCSKLWSYFLKKSHRQELTGWEWLTHLGLLSEKGKWRLAKRQPPLKVASLRSLSSLCCPALSRLQSSIPIDRQSCHTSSQWGPNYFRVVMSHGNPDRLAEVKKVVNLLNYVQTRCTHNNPNKPEIATNELSVLKDERNRNQFEAKLGHDSEVIIFLRFRFPTLSLTSQVVGWGRRERGKDRSFLPSTGSIE